MGGVGVDRGWRYIWNFRERFFERVKNELVFVEWVELIRLWGRKG